MQVICIEGRSYCRGATDTLLLAYTPSSEAVYHVDGYIGTQHNSRGIFPNLDRLFMPDLEKEPAVSLALMQSASYFQASRRATYSSIQKKSKGLPRAHIKEQRQYSTYPYIPIPA